MSSRNSYDLQLIKAEVGEPTFNRWRDGAYTLFAECKKHLKNQEDGTHIKPSESREQFASRYILEQYSLLQSQVTAQHMEEGDLEKTAQA